MSRAFGVGFITFIYTFCRYRFSPDDYKDVAKIWTGSAPDGSGQLEVIDGPPEGSPYPEYASVPENFVPEYHPEEIFEIAEKLVKKA